MIYDSITVVACWVPSNKPMITYLHPTHKTTRNGHWYRLWGSMFAEPLWRHDMQTLCAILALCEGNPPKGPVIRGFNTLLYVRLNMVLSNQSIGQSFETARRSCDVSVKAKFTKYYEISGDHVDHFEMVSNLQSVILHWWTKGLMMTSSNGNISALLALCAGNSPVTDEFPAQMPVMRSFNVFFDLRLNKRLSKQWWG